MDFELTDDQLELQRTVRDVLERECAPEVVRALAAGGSADSLWATLVDLDWPGLALPEQYGGIGYTWVELAIVLEEMGRVAAPGPFQATVTQFGPVVGAAATPGQAAEWLSAVASGDLTGALALDEGSGTWDTDTIAATGTIDGDEIVLAGTKRYVLDGASADEVAVVVRVDGDLRVVVVPGGSLAADAYAPIDPTSVHADLVLDGVRVPADRLLGEGPADLTVAIDEATAAVALITVGACARIFDMTLEYAKERHQFDVPIGSFQAVKHKLADMYRDVERARAVAFYAALCLAEGDERASMATAMAKAAAGECQQRCAQDGLQLFGGIGFTWENDLHFFLRRAKVGELTFGGASHHRQRVGRMALA